MLLHQMPCVNEIKHKTHWIWKRSGVVDCWDENNVFSNTFWNIWTFKCAHYDWSSFILRNNKKSIVLLRVLATYICVFVTYFWFELCLFSSLNHFWVFFPFSIVWNIVLAEFPHVYVFSFSVSSTVPIFKLWIRTLNKRTSFVSDTFII